MKSEVEEIIDRMRVLLLEAEGRDWQSENGMERVIRNLKLNVMKLSTALRNERDVAILQDDEPPNDDHSELY